MKKTKRFRFSLFFYLIIGLAVAAAGAALIPIIVLSPRVPDISSTAPQPFPLTVDPARKTISEDPQVEAALSNGNLSLTSAALNAGDFFYDAAAAIASMPAYQLVAATGFGPRIVTIEPGFRKEEVADALGAALRWNKSARDAFLKSLKSGPNAIPEGHFFPGVYAVESGMTAPDLATLFRERFERKVLARYSTTTEAVIPVDEALTIASMIERETSDKEEMRIISGIIWNRTFANMKLQLDSTLQYAKANGRNGWWPIVRSRDKFISSPYNTYQNTGLPPGPIANPSVAAIIAALNPKKTTCLYYFHDANGDFHCSDTYEGHVALLKQYFGRGK